MPEKSLKHQAFWFCVSFAFVAGLALAAGVVSMRQCPQVEPGTTCRLEIVHKPASVGHLLDATKMIGKRSEPGKLAPETEHVEHWRMVRAIQRGLTTQAVIDGPPGLDAPCKRVK